MIEQLIDAEPRRRRRTRDTQDIPDPVHDREGRSIPVLDDAQQDGAPAVFADDVLLHRPAIVHLADILQKNRCLIRKLDGDIVEVIDGLGHRIGENRVLSVADLGLA